CGERRMHEAGGPRVRRLERRGAVPVEVSEPAHDATIVLVIAGDALRLSLARDLDLVLDVAQDAVRRSELAREYGIDVARPRQALGRAERPAHLEAGVLPAVHELLRLHPELDLADAATTELHIALVLALAQRLVDTPLHRLQVLERGKVEVAAIDERRQLV